MPNWCSTTYICTGRKKSIKKLYHVLTELSKGESRIKNDFGNLWLGNVVDSLGGNWEEIRCRGKIMSYNLDPKTRDLIIYQETAWCEQSEFRYFLESKLQGLKIYYLEEESGCEIYYTNDATGLYFPDRYILECEGIDDGYYEYYSDFNKMILDVEDFTEEKFTGPKTEEGLNEYLNEFNERPENYDNGISCYYHKILYSEN